MGKIIPLHNDCSCGGLHALSKAYRFDPTRTTTLRKTFSTAISKRFIELKREIRKKIVDEDYFNLKPRRNPLKLNKDPFLFTIDPEKYTGFLAWLKGAVNRGILEVGADVDALTPEMIQHGWMNPYIKSAYQKGIARAGQELKKAGFDTPTRVLGDPVQFAFNQPFHLNRISLIYARAFNELKGITDTMSSQISRVLSEGMVDGRSPLEIAKALNDRVDKIGITRAKMLARTEVIASHHSANIAEYRAAGVEGVNVQAEWLTAGDGKVCEKCIELASRGDIKPGVYSLDKIETMIPAHPNCRCMAIPWNSDWDERSPKAKPKKKRTRKPPSGMTKEPSGRMIPSKEVQASYLEKWQKADDQYVITRDGYNRGHLPRVDMEKAFKAERNAFYRYMNVAPDKIVTEHKVEILKKMAGVQKLTTYKKGMFADAAQGFPIDILDALRQENVRIVFKSKLKRAYYHFGEVHIANGARPQVLAHELAHAVDDMFGNFLGPGHIWVTESGFVKAADGARYRSWFAKQHSGQIGISKRTDGHYYLGNWMNIYEGKIYHPSSIGEEWWSMNIERFTKYRYSVNNYYSRIKSFQEDIKYYSTRDKNIFDQLIEGLQTKIDNMKEMGPENWALNVSEWGKAKSMYPELTDFIETNFSKVTFNDY